MNNTALSPPPHLPPAVKGGEWLIHLPERRRASINPTTSPVVFLLASGSQTPPKIRDDQVGAMIVFLRVNTCTRTERESLCVNKSDNFTAQSAQRRSSSAFVINEVASSDLLGLSRLRLVCALRDFSCFANGYAGLFCCFFLKKIWFWHFQ